MAEIDYGLLAGGMVADFLNSVYGGWTIVAAAMLALSAALVTLAYMAGAMLSNDRIKAWARMEFVEIFYSVVLIGLTLALLTGMDSVVQNIAFGVKDADVICGAAFDASEYYSGVPCHIRLAMGFMNSLFNEAKETLFAIYWKYSLTSALAEMTINLEVITEQTGVFAYNPIKGFFAISNAVEALMFDYMMKLMTISKFQEVLLRLIAVGIFPVMFTIGIVLRTFFFTRKLGGLLMAISLALYFIFPMFYVVGGAFFSEFKYKAVAATWDPGAHALNYMYVDMDGFPSFSIDAGGGPTGQGKLDISAIMDSDRGLYDLDPASAGNAYRSNFINNPYETDYGKAAEAVGAATGNLPDLCGEIKENEAQGKKENIEYAAQDWLAKLEKKSYYEKTMGLPMLFKPGGYIDAASRVTFFSLFFSFLGVMASIAAIKSLSGLFGGDLEIAGLTHLI